MSGPTSNAELLRKLDKCENGVTRGVLKDCIVSRFRGQWKPIETAPIGVDILGYTPPHKYGADPHYVTCYRTERPHSPTHLCEENVQSGQPCNPTHWMPLPEPPE